MAACCRKREGDETRESTVRGAKRRRAAYLSVGCMTIEMFLTVILFSSACATMRSNIARSSLSIARFCSGKTASSSRTFASWTAGSFSYLSRNATHVASRNAGTSGSASSRRNALQTAQSVCGSSESGKYPSSMSARKRCTRRWSPLRRNSPSSWRSFREADEEEVSKEGSEQGGK